MSEWPTDHQATLAVDAAARHSYETGRDKALESLARAGQTGQVVPEWDDLHPLAKNTVREQVLSVVWAALKALPDPRREAWSDGLAYGQWHPEDATAYLENPYPSGL